MPKMIVADLDRCVACKACVTECALAHCRADTLAEAVSEDAVVQPRTYVEAAGEIPVPIRCRHCRDAACIPVCPADAIGRESDDAGVLVDAETCIGCRFCAIACPYGIVEMAQAEKLAVKCDLCAGRLDAPGRPACVEACPTRALELRDIDEATGEWVERIERQVTDSLRAEGEGEADGDAVCADCGCEIGPVQSRVRRKLPEQFALADLCARCRRLRYAAVLAETPAPQTAGTVEE